MSIFIKKTTPVVSVSTTSPRPRTRCVPSGDSLSLFSYYSSNSAAQSRHQIHTLSSHASHTTTAPIPSATLPFPSLPELSPSSLSSHSQKRSNSSQTTSLASKGSAYPPMNGGLNHSMVLPPMALEFPSLAPYLLPLTSLKSLAQSLLSIEASGSPLGRPLLLRLERCTMLVKLG